jgi:hypothetical protein
LVRLVGPVAVAIFAAWACGCAAQSHRHSDSKATAGVQIGRRIATAPTPAPSRTTPALPHPPSRASEPDPPPRASAAASAERPARRFFDSYVSFLYGRIAATSVADVERPLRAKLRSGLAFITPAERAARPRIARVAVTPAGPPLSALATATVLAGGDRYRLTVILEPRGDGWLVVALDP